jgi:putative salt-induced outer membrane protein YdiY
MNHPTCSFVTWTAAWGRTLALLCSLVLPVWADPLAQVIITTQTGDRLSGRLLKATAEQLEIETTYAGRISIRTTEIESWQTRDEHLRQQLSAVLPNLTPTPAKSEPKLAATHKAVTKKPAQTAANAPASPATKTAKDVQWQRAVNLAYTFSRGNSNINDLNGSFGLARKYGQQRLVFNSLGRYSERNGAQVAHLLSGTFRYENAVNKLPTFSETIFEIDRIKRLDYRFSESLGVTYPALKREAQQLSLDFGTGVTREVYNNGQQRTTATSLLRAKAEQKISGKAQLSQQISLFSDLLDPENYRMHTDVSLTMPINKYLGFRVAGLNRFDNRPAALNIKQNDFSLLTGFNINF